MDYTPPFKEKELIMRMSRINSGRLTDGKVYVVKECIPRMGCSIIEDDRGGPFKINYVTTHLWKRIEMEHNEHALQLLKEE